MRNWHGRRISGNCTYSWPLLVFVSVLDAVVVVALVVLLCPGVDSVDAANATVVVGFAEVVDVAGCEDVVIQVRCPVVDILHVDDAVEVAVFVEVVDRVNIVSQVEVKVVLAILKLSLKD